MWHKSQDTSTEAATGPDEQTRKQSRFQLGFQQMFMDLEPNAWMTLVFNRYVHADAARSKLKRFHERLDRIVVGRDKWDRNPDCRSPYIGVIENADTNLHIHVAFRFPADRLDIAFGKADAVWRKLASRGNVVIKVPYDLPGLASYNAKQLTAAKSDLLLI